jgi:hypothetical protein
MKVALRRSFVLAVSVLVAGITPRLARAQEAPSRFVDEQTAAVIRFDLDKIDVNAAAKWLTDASGAGRAEAAAGVGGAQHAAELAVRDLKKAGAKQVYVVLSLADVPFRGPAPGFIVVPLPGDGGDAAAIAIGNVLTTGRAGGANAGANAVAKAGANGGAQAGGGNADWKSETIDNAVVAGSAATLERLRAGKPAPREDLAKVLAGGGAAGDDKGAAIVAAVAPTDDMRKVVEEMLPNLPAQVGGGPATTLTRGVRWARLVINLPPEGSLRLTIQSQDAAAAQAMADVVGGAIKFVSGLPELRRAAGGDAMDRLARAVRPKVEQDRVVVAVDRGQLNDVVPPLAAAMTTARRRAALMRSANQVRQLLLGVIMYADAHQGQFPDTLEEAAKTAAGGDNASAAALLRNPRGAARYQYLKPKVGLSALGNVSETLILYEKAEKWEAPAVLGFADGHVITVKDEAEFRKHVEAAGKAE